MKKIIPISSLRMFNGEDLSIFNNLSVWRQKNDLINVIKIMDTTISTRKKR